MRIALLIAVLLAQLSSQEPPRASLDNPHYSGSRSCSINENLQKRRGDMPCTCLRMVAAVQADAIDRCMRDSVDHRNYVKCLGEKVPDHYQVIDSGGTYSEYKKHAGAKGEHICAVQCRAKQCQCPDAGNRKR